MKLAPLEEIAMLLKTCRAYYGLTGPEEPSVEPTAPELPAKTKRH